MSYKTQSGNAKFYWAAVAVICGYTIGAYDKNHSFLVVQKLGASVTAIHLLVSGVVLFYTMTALKLIRERAHLSLSRFGEALQDVSDQASSDIVEAITGLQEVAEQIKTEVERLNIRDVHDKLGRIAQSIQIAAAKPQPGQPNNDKQKNSTNQKSQQPVKQPQNQEPQKSVESKVQARPYLPEQKARAKSSKQEITAQQTVSHETNSIISQPSEKTNVPAPANSKSFRPEPQPPVKPGVNEEAFLD